ncbi:M3 family metallopeptidase [Hyphobacterium sp. HN65]|uniref:M3 family metallopeptidase n=1 Tax=Hyphobacterium lacteum TaxID=3116575 RepID=A0ABU7LRI1_9PROT|nr:M3 family metallopeptidase [Hyphobacterium sp. HN65]MEE2526519.1 M3 family metallopeptidase [Hyphobacterium sp. HN65]
MKRLLITSASLSVLALAACAEPAAEDADTAMDETAMETGTTTDDAAMDETAEAAFDWQAELETNPLLAELSGPYGGVPQFDEASLDMLTPAVRAGMAAHLAEIDEIANNPEPPTFENTIVAMERAGAPLGRVFNFWGIWSSNMSSPEFRELQRSLSPELSAYNSQITQNQALFDRIRTVYETEMDSLRPDQQRLVQITYDGFARNGATLEGEAAERYAEINQRLSELHTQFANNVLHDEESYVTYLTEDQLGGLSQSLIDAYASAAAERGRDGEYAVTNTRSSMDPFLTFSTERDLRETVWRTYYSRGNNGDEYDNNAIIAEILQLRDERVGLLGYDNYAQWRLENRMAGTPERAMELMEAVWPAAIGRVAEEVEDMQALADERGDGITIEPWDYRYYMELIRQDRYDLDSNEVRQYLQLDNLLQAMFYVAGELFNFEFTPVPDGSVPVWHEDVTVYEVTDRDSGEHVGVWYLDPFARTGKRSGAWASSFRGHTTFDGLETPLSTNNSNFVEPAPGEPVLISWDDANTFFHEFGHALHTLSSNVEYPTLNGGVRDYTEFQSQLLERWLFTEPVIENYFVHVETGEPMPDELVERIQAAATFNQGFATTEYLASALVDMAYHTVDPEGIDPQEFERQTLADLEMPPQLPMRHRSTQFGHIFSGEGYSAGYYGYMWADVLTSDAAEAFAEAPGGFYDQNLAQSLVENLFAPRNSVDPAEAYRAFRGRDANIGPLMRDRGFPVPDGTE